MLGQLMSFGENLEGNAFIILHFYFTAMTLIKMLLIFEMRRMNKFTLF